VRGNKKTHTKLLLDRERVLPFYITQEQRELYEADEFKYLIHLLKVYPTDEFHIIQYLLLKFHPLLINTCKKFYAKKINLDWTDLLSFARYSFVELILRFNLNSTLFFKTYIPLALDRAINDFLLYDIRRLGLQNAVSLDSLPFQERELFLRENVIVQNKDNRETECHEDHVDEYRAECVTFVRKLPNFTHLEKQVFIENFVKNKALIQICKDKRLSFEIYSPKMVEILEEVKEHIRLNFI
jgi:hypothetical protein